MKLKKRWLPVFIIITTLIIGSACALMSDSDSNAGEEVSVSEEMEEPEEETSDSDQEDPTSSYASSGDIEDWRKPVGIGLYVTSVCQDYMDTAAGNDAGTMDPFEVLESVIVSAALLEAADEGMQTWDAGDLSEYKTQLEESSESIKSVISNWVDEIIDASQVVSDLEPVCASAEGAFSGIQDAAKQEGINEDDLSGLVSELTLEMEELFEEDTAADAEEESEETSEADVEAEEGMSRSNPYPAGTLQTAPNWEIQIVETNRGDEAWQLIQAENMFNDPPVEGMEYINIFVHVTCMYEDDDEHTISDSDFRLTGSNYVRYGWDWVVSPSPQLDATLYTGGEAEGWISFEIGEGEDNLILIFDELSSWDDDRYRYFAVDVGAVVTVPEGLDSIEADEQGLSRSDPAESGSLIVTEDWKLQVKEVIRGAEAWALLSDENLYNDPPEEGMEYVMVRTWAQNINPDEEYQDIDSSYFDITGDLSTVYEHPFVVEPEPVFGSELFPGGETEGWVVLQASEGETGLKLIFDPWMSYNDEKRFISLEE